VGPSFSQHFGLVPRLVLEERWIWQPVTYMFVHGGFFHLFFNLFMLWMFGMAIEAQWGTREFLKFYFICGLGVAVVKVLLWPHSMTPLVGASGALFGLLVAFAMLYPDAVVYLYFLIPVKAAHMAILCGLMELFLMFSQGDRGVDHFAHLTGLAVGYLYIRWWWEIKLRFKAALLRLRPEAPAAKPRRPARPRRVPPGPPEPSAGMEDVDRILDKILASGMGSLTEEERAIMRRYSDRMQH
jgi:membrane associated rhomboid family serine protease